MGNHMKIISIPLYIICFVLITIFLGYLIKIPLRKSEVRELKPEEIKQRLKSVVGKELPQNIEDIKSILYIEGDKGGYEELFISFHTNNDGCLHVLKEFGNQDIQNIQKFPKALIDKDLHFWQRGNFDKGCDFQKKIGIELFKEDLIAKVNGDCMQYAQTGKYPEDAVSDYFLYFESEDEQKFISFYYVLIFKDKGTIYIDAGKKSKAL
jgi:hypothetical protein